MGIITLGLLILLELFFLIWSMKTRRIHRKEKGIVNISLLLLFGLLLIVQIYEWSFRYVLFFLVLLIKAIFGGVILLSKNKTGKEYNVKRVSFRLISNCIIFAFALFLAILFPQYEQAEESGEYKLATAKYTWTDESRVERNISNYK